MVVKFNVILINFDKSSFKLLDAFIFKYTFNKYCKFILKDKNLILGAR